MTVAGASGSGSAAVAGSFAVLVMNVTTQSLVQNSSESVKGSMTASGSVEISAADKTALTLTVGGKRRRKPAVVGVRIG